MFLDSMTFRTWQIFNRLKLSSWELRPTVRHLESRVLLTLFCRHLMGFPGGSDAKCLPAMQETRVQSLNWEDPLEKEMATHSSTLAWKIPWAEEPCKLQSMGLQRVRHEPTSLHFTSIHRHLSILHLRLPWFLHSDTIHKFKNKGWSYI